MNTEKILEVVNRLQRLSDSDCKCFLFYFLGAVTVHVLQHPGQSANDLVKTLVSCAEMMGPTVGKISSAPAEGLVDPKNPDAGASDV